MSNARKKLPDGIPLFQGLPEQQINEIESIMVQQTYDRGDIIFSEGDEASGLFVLISGRLKIFKISPEGKEQILHFVDPGDPFAEIGMFSGSHYPAHAEALTGSEVVLFPKARFEQLIRNDPDLAMNMLGILIRRLKYFSRLVEDLSLKEVPQRLAAYLVYLADTGQRSALDLDISKGQLASLLGTIPETLSRILNRMSAQGFISVDGRMIKMLDRNAVEALASGQINLKV
ncbi:MAG TPA: Crp/Fnr family transcriptional regulator [Syntrophorhabdaceae bacterium]|nr:Crp/Fnr family transcriptional regulator [Syntrophorhabdaceae bacterium]